MYMVHLHDVERELVRFRGGETITCVRCAGLICVFEPKWMVITATVIITMNMSGVLSSYGINIIRIYAYKYNVFVCCIVKVS